MAFTACYVTDNVCGKASFHPHFFINFSQLRLARNVKFIARKMPYGETTCRITFEGLAKRRGSKKYFSEGEYLALHKICPMERIFRRNVAIRVERRK
jgi:hypothetical protein